MSPRNVCVVCNNKFRKKNGTFQRQALGEKINKCSSDTWLQSLQNVLGYSVDMGTECLKSHFACESCALLLRKWRVASTNAEKKRKDFLSVLKEDCLIYRCEADVSCPGLRSPSGGSGRGKDRQDLKARLYLADLTLQMSRAIMEECLSLKKGEVKQVRSSVKDTRVEVSSQADDISIHVRSIPEGAERPVTCSCTVSSDFSTAMSLSYMHPAAPSPDPRKQDTDLDIPAVDNPEDININGSKVKANTFDVISGKPAQDQSSKTDIHSSWSDASCDINTVLFSNDLPEFRNTCSESATKPRTKQEVESSVDRENDGSSNSHFESSYLPKSAQECTALSPKLNNTDQTVLPHELCQSTDNKDRSLDYSRDLDIKTEERGLAGQAGRTIGVIVEAGTSMPHPNELETSSLDVVKGEDIFQNTHISSDGETEMSDYDVAGADRSEEQHVTPDVTSENQNNIKHHNLKRHTPEELILNPGDRCAACELCGKSYMKLFNLRLHVKQLHSQHHRFADVIDKIEKAVASTSCKRSTKGSLGRLSRNTKSPTDTSLPYKCHECSRTFKSLKSIKIHMSREHRNKNQDTPENKSVSVDRSNAGRGVSKRRRNMVKCPVCGLFFQHNTNGITRHMAKVHPTFIDTALGDIEKQFQSRDAENPPTESAAEEEVAQLSNYADSQENEGNPQEQSTDVPPEKKCDGVNSPGLGTTRIPCELCNGEFPNATILVHLKQQHSGEENVRDLIEKYRKVTRQLRDAKYKEARAKDAGGQIAMQECPFCHKLCKRASLISHMRGCRDNPDGIVLKHCVCGYKTQSLEQMKAHKLDCRLKNATFLCHLCGKNFNKKPSLYYHRRAVHGLCGKNFTMTYYPCPVCDKKFTAPSRLKRHANTHSEVSRCMCDVCGASFTRLDGLRMHVRSQHNNVYRFHCLQCGHGTNKRHQFQNHQCGKVRSKRPQRLSRVPGTGAAPSGGKPEEDLRKKNQKKTERAAIPPAHPQQQHVTPHAQLPLPPGDVTPRQVFPVVTSLAPDVPSPHDHVMTHSHVTEQQQPVMPVQQQQLAASLQQQQQQELTSLPAAQLSQLQQVVTQVVSQAVSQVASQGELMGANLVQMNAPQADMQAVQPIHIQPLHEFRAAATLLNSDVTLQPLNVLPSAQTANYTDLTNLLLGTNLGAALGVNLHFAS